MTLRTLRSALDDSVNFVETLGPGQALESRYVRRVPEEVTIYLSTQTACAQRCRFCHLTTTGQVWPEEASSGEILNQAVIALEAYRDRDAVRANFNFMARGEPLAVRRDWAFILTRLSIMAQKVGLLPSFKISTILPVGLQLPLAEHFAPYAPDIYYSLYSVHEEFRKRWMPSALSADEGLEILAEWQRLSHKIPRIHLALIAGWNDYEDHLHDLGAACRGYLDAVAFNLVRYNPPDQRTREGDLGRAYNILRKYGPTQAVDRVGLDVHASCGMFYSA